MKWGRSAFVSAMILLTAVAMVGMIVSAAQAATATWTAEGVLVNEANPLELGFGDSALVELSITPNHYMLMDAYWLGFITDMGAALTQWQHNSVDLGLADIDSEMPYGVYASLEMSKMVSPLHPQMLGTVSVEGRKSGYFAIDCEGEAIGGSGSEIINSGTSNCAVVHVGMPELITGGRYAPTLGPYTSSVWANNDHESGTNDDYVSAYGVVDPWNWDPPSEAAEAQASIQTCTDATTSTIGIQIQGKAGRTVDNSDPEFPFEDPIPTSASGQFEGSIYFDPTEVGLAAGTPLELTLSLLTCDIDGDWSCQLTRDGTILAEMGAGNLHTTVDVFVGETDLELSVEMYDSSSYDSFDSQLYVALSAVEVPEPTAFAMLLAIGLTLLVRPGRSATH